jgi:hypothetical protein
VLRSVKKCLKSGGRFVAEFGGFANISGEVHVDCTLNEFADRHENAVGLRSSIYTVLKARGYNPAELDPWYFPSAETYSERLTSHGFTIKRIELEPRLTPLSGRLADWLYLFCRHSMLEKMNDEEAKEIIDAIEDACRIDCQTETGKWMIMYCRLRFEAINS